MSPLRSIILSGALAALARAYTNPTTATWGALLTPDLNDPVTQGETFVVTWDPSSHPTDGVTVSLVLCHGSSTNCVNSPSAIVEGIPAGQKSYPWAVPCDLAPGTKSTDSGYGMLIIVDGTGEFQYSTQFSVLSSPSCSSGTTASASVNSTSTLQSAGGWTTASFIGPGQGGYSNGTTTVLTTSTSSAGITAPTSIVSATGLSATAVATGTTSYAVASPSAPAATTSSFSGAGTKVQTGGLFGLIAGAFAMLAL